MKRFFGIVMLLLLLLVSFRPAVIIIHFKLNQKSIEQEFCINKANFELQCHGKCHLNKKLEQSEKNSNLELNNIVKEIEFALISNIEMTIEIFKITNTNKVTAYKKNNLSDPYLKIFLPPPIFNYC